MLTLVTGLNGFTGQYIKLELEAHGHSVVGLKSDLTDREAVFREIKAIKPESVVHLASIAFVDHGNSNSFYEVNLIGTNNLLSAIYENSPNITSVLLASSANVYGNSDDDLLNEDTLPNPTNDYAVSKLSMENMSKLWFKKLPLFIVRPFNYTGLGQDEMFLIPKIISHFKNRKKIIELGNLDVWREFGDVRSVTDIYRKLIDHCPIGKIINVCTSQPYSLREIVGMCQQITGHEIEVKVNSDFVRENEVRILTGDNGHLKKIICNWKEYKLEDTIDWMLNEN